MSTPRVVSEAENRRATRMALVLVGIPVACFVLLIGGCAALATFGKSDANSTSGYQLAVRDQCRDLVRNQIGQVDFRDEQQTSSTGTSGSTEYQATGRADAAVGSYSYSCSGTVLADSDKSLTVHLDTLS